MTGSSPPDPTAPEPTAAEPTPPGPAASPETSAAAGSVSAERPEATRRASAARRRIAEVFGEVLPETTSDERDPQRGPATSDDWYLQNRPPHHDG